MKQPCNDIFMNFSWACPTFLIEHSTRVGEVSITYNHFHDSYEIFYLVSGERYYFINDNTYLIKKGDVVLLNKRIIHRTFDAEIPDHERILVIIHQDFLNEFLNCIHDINLFSPFHQDVNVIHLNPHEQSILESILFKTICEIKSTSVGNETLLRMSLIELMIYLNRYSLLSHTNYINHSSSFANKVSEIVKYINKNYMNRLNLESVSREFFISPFYMSKIFRKVTGFTFVEYINQVRSKEAQRLLDESKLSVTKIAYKVGFESITHFGRVFRKVVGLSPSTYRKGNTNRALKQSLQTNG
jgi:AraC-like DNA-binding protein